MHEVGRRTDVDELRELARNGVLVETASATDPDRRTMIQAALYKVAWPVVFKGLTRGLELRRGHLACAQGLDRMAPECLDRFHTDVEAVVDNALRRATGPIENLEAWLTARLTAATVDGHRRQRGLRGALQRPRLPKWLARELCDDAWLTDLAVRILDWVGIRMTAGGGLWPLDSWAARRAEVTGDWASSDPATVAREVERVLAAMRGRPTWYADHVERPLSHKEPPVASSEDAARQPLLLVERYEIDEARLTALATTAIDVIEARLRRGDAPEAVVTDVVRAIFCTDEDCGSIERIPHSDPAGDERLTALLTEPAEVNRIVRAILAIVNDRSDTQCDVPSQRHRSTG